MLKKPLIQILLMGIIAFASVFVIISATKVPDTQGADSIESSSKTEAINPSGDFILETFVGSILIGTN